MRALLILASLLLAGCASTAGPSASPANGSNVAPPAASPGAANASAPDLAVGTTFTFAAKRAYDPDPEKVVVVAKATPEGYRFAAGDPDDLVYGVAWGDALYGDVGRDLDAEGHWNALEFPLADGASWAVTKTLNVTARAADVHTPAGIERGFVIEGKSARGHLRIEYSPRIGMWTSWLYEVDGKPFDALTLRSVSTRTTWISVGQVQPVYAGDPAKPQTLDVGKADAVVLSAGGRDGSRVTIAMPDGQTWTQDFQGVAAPDGAWVNHVFAPTAGKWIVTIEGRPHAPVDPPAEPPADVPVGWAAAAIAPVTWIRST